MSGGLQVQGPRLSRAGLGGPSAPWQVGKEKGLLEAQEKLQAFAKH